MTDTSNPPSADELCANPGLYWDQEPPADQLWRVRAELKVLTERESALKSLMLTDPSARVGNKYLVEIKVVQTNRTDIKELRAVYPDIVEQFTFQLTQERVELRGISEDGEITSLRRKPAS